MKKVLIPSHSAAVPTTAPAFPLTHDSIILVDPDGLEMVVGASAFELAPNSGRVFGGSPEDLHYQRLVQALAAKGLGAGEHEITVGLSAAVQYVMKLRESRGTNSLSEQAGKALVSSLSEIRFREGRSDAPIKTCRITLKENVATPVLFETEAVAKVMPAQARSYLLFQIGCGDWQSCAVVDGKIQHHTHQRVAGISGAEGKLRSMLQLSAQEARRAWERGQCPAKNMGSEYVSCEKEKIMAARSHITESLPLLLNSIDGLQDRISALVISGGAVHDQVFIEQLKKEIPSTFKVFTLSDLKIIDAGEPDNIMDPIFACASGIKNMGVSAALDIGNANLKGIFTYD